MQLALTAFLIQEKKEKLLQKLIQNKIAKCVVISDSTLESEIGSMNECTELFAHTDNVAVVGGISSFIAFEQQFRKPHLMDTWLRSSSNIR